MKEKRKIITLTVIAIVLAIVIVWVVQNRFALRTEELPVEKAVTAFNDFLDAFNRGDIETMWNMLSADERNRITLENFLKVVKTPGQVTGRKIGTLELVEATVKDVEGNEITLTVKIIEHGAVPVGDPEDPKFPWENRDFEGTGEVRLKFEGGEWKINVPVVPDPNPNKPIHVLELNVKAEPVEVNTGGKITLNFEIKSKSPLPISLHHAHTPARVILYRGEREIARFPQVILDILVSHVLGPFGSENYEEIIPSIYQTHGVEDGLFPTFSEPGIYKLVPFAEFNVWWEPGKPTEPHRLFARAIEIPVVDWPVVHLQTFNMRFLDFYGKEVGELDGRFKMLKGNGDVKVVFELDLSSRARWYPRIQSLTLDMNVGFFGFFEAHGPPPSIPPPAFTSVTMKERERIVLHERMYDVRKLENPLIYVGFKINSVRAVFSDGQQRTIPVGTYPFWHEEYEFPPAIKGIELVEGVRQHFHRVGVDLALELDNRMYHENSVIRIKVTNLTDNVLNFVGGKHDIAFQKWMKREKCWSGNIFMETEAISLLPKRSHVFSYPVEELAREMRAYDEWMQKYRVVIENLLPLPGRYRVICHNSSAEFWIR